MIFGNFSSTDIHTKYSGTIYFEKSCTLCDGHFYPLPFLHLHENCWKHGQHASRAKKIKLRNQRDMAYLELKIVDNACINYQKRTLLMPFFINLLMIEAKLFPQSPYFASNILRFGEEPDKLTKMLPEPNNTILMSGC